MTRTQKLAKLIRILTVPPIMVILLIVMLWVHCRTMFLTAWDACFAVLFLGIAPLLAYPMQKWIPGYKTRGREGQRELAFIFNIVGYIAAWGYGLISGASRELQFIFNAYLLSVLILSAVNKLLRVQASGHACSVIAPAGFACYFGVYAFAGVYLVLAAASMWASVYLKRHKPSDMLWGVLTFACAFFIATLFL